MQKIIIKRIISAFLLLTFTHIYPAEKTWSNTISPHHMGWYVAAATTALIIGKIAYNYYQGDLVNSEQTIKNCRSLYQQIYQDTYQYYHFYQRDAQISDWDLKEIIMHNNKQAYPFMTYYSSLIEAYLVLKEHLSVLDNQLTTIDIHKKQLYYNTAKRAARQQLIQLETKGKQIQKYILKTITLLIILKNRLQLFKEYKDDYHHWIQAEQTTHYW
ncbi:MAG TPA: hypothetical protein VKR54_01455 [Candidatus Babeliales bacterium]|jgi:hypothetical protein|nr:hypothetical protein [Candidatus Babeliales bacterium]